MRLGVSSHAYAWAVGVPGWPPPPEPLTAVGLVRKAAELGVRVVQIADNLPLDRLDGWELDVLAETAARLGVSLEVGTCGIAPDHLREYLRLAVRLKSPIVRVVPDTAMSHPSPAAVVEACREVVPEFARADVTLAIENHDRFPAASLADTVTALGGRHVGVCLDTANSLGCGEGLETVLRVLGRFTVNLHVKDFRVTRPPHKKGFVTEGCTAGAGQLDIPALLAELRAHGRDPNAVLELWPPPEPTPGATVAKEADWVAESVRYLRRFIPD